MKHMDNLNTLQLLNVLDTFLEFDLAVRDKRRLFSIAQSALTNNAESIK